MSQKFYSVVFLALVAILYTIPAQSQSTYNKPELEDKESWTMIMIPDIQNYVKWERNVAILDIMTQWIEDNIDTLNIKMVAQVGDLIQNNEKIANDYDG